MSFDDFIKDMKVINNKSIELAKRLLADSIWKEAHIEGIAVTFPETQEIIDGRNVASLSVDDIIKINNLKHAWNFVLTSLDKDITKLSYINNVNYEVCKNLAYDCGKIRSADISIGGTKWRPSIPNEYLIEDTLQKLSYNSNIADYAIELGCYIMRQQFYIDGNKRTAQLVMNAHLIKHNIGILQIDTDKRIEFLTLLIEYYNSNDICKLKEFLKNCIKN